MQKEQRYIAIWNYLTNFAIGFIRHNTFTNNNMRRLLLSAAFILMLMFAACENGDNSGSKIVITSPVEMNIGMYGGRATITYTTVGDVSPEDIDVTHTGEWLRIVSSKALGEVVIDTEVNETGGTRMGAVTIVFGSQRETIVINQSGTPEEPVITLTSASEIELDRAGQPIEITYTIKNKNLEGYTFAKVDSDWIYSIDTKTDGIVTLHVATNCSNVSRTANIEVGYDSSSFNVSLTQAGEGDYNFTATTLDGEYYGDVYTPGAGNYWLKLSDRGFNSEGASMPFGTYYRIDAYGLVYSGDNSQIELPEGEYTYDPEGTYASWTFVADYSDFFVNDKNGKHEEKHAIESGKMIVKENQITLELVINGQKHNVVYNGDTTVVDARGDITILSTLDDDYALDLSNHTMIYECYGDYYDYGYTNWMFVIMPNSGTGDCIQFDIITSYSDEADGFTGDYVSSDVLATNSFIPGWVQSDVMECSWFFTADTSERAPMRGGTMSVKANDDGTFTVDIDVEDDLRNRIYGSWTGEAREYEE